MNYNKKLKLLKWVEKAMKRGVKDKGRAKQPAMTNNYGRIIKKGK